MYSIFSCLRRKVVFLMAKTEMNISVPVKIEDQDVYCQPQNIAGNGVNNLWSFIKKLNLPEDFLEDIYDLEDIVIYTQVDLSENKKSASNLRLSLNNGHEWMTVSVDVKMLDAGADLPLLGACYEAKNDEQ